MRGCNKIAVFCVLCLALPLSSTYVFAHTIIPLGNIKINLYIISMSGVGGYGSDIVTGVVEGALAASQVDSVHCRGLVDPIWPITLGEVKVNITVKVIDKWNEYEELVETASNVIIVNAHGEIVPVPAGYAKEEWVDKIAEAMTDRNVTWVHTGGYPFYYYYLQGSGEGEWGEDGFKRLMSHIGKNDVTCYCYPPSAETDILMMHEYAWQTLHDWDYSVCAYHVERGKPLKASDFEDCLVTLIWGDEQTYLTGATLKFAKTNQTGSYGFYVHIGTRNTFLSNNTETAGNYYRGYVGTAQALYTVSFRIVAESAISKARATIAAAESEGRTKGLGEASQLLQNAQTEYAFNDYVAAIKNANDSVVKANQATAPSFLEVYGVPLLAASAVVGAFTTGFMKRKSSKGNKEAPK